MNSHSKHDLHPILRILNYHFLLHAHIYSGRGACALYLYLFPFPLTIHLQVMAINETWLHRCDHGQLFTSAALQDDKIPYSTVFAGLLSKFSKKSSSVQEFLTPITTCSTRVVSHSTTFIETFHQSSTGTTR